MKCRAGIVHGVGGEWSIEEIEVDPPKAGEVLVEWKVAGMCHSDEHLVTGDMVPPDEMAEMLGIEQFFPIVGGHEGAGVIAEVGPGVTSVQPGDHVSASFVPSCGRCRYCSTGRQNLCDAGAGTFQMGMITDGTSRHRISGSTTDLNLFAKLGTFSEYSCVAESQVIKVEADLPLEAVALVSCGVATGFGSADQPRRGAIPATRSSWSAPAGSGSTPSRVPGSQVHATWSPSTLSSSSGRSRWSSVPHTRSRRWRRRSRRCRR